MKRVLVILITLFTALSASAQLKDRTLRVDYIFSGTDKQASISVASLSSFDTWAGRRVNMDKVPLRGNGQIFMEDAVTGKVLYRMSFSTLFQEWQATEEATRVTKAFENVFLLPMPESRVNITVELFDLHGKPAASLTHPVDPSDILIRPIGANPPRTVDILSSGPAAEAVLQGFDGLLAAHQLGDRDAADLFAAELETVFLADDDFLGDVHQPAGQVT